MPRTPADSTSPQTTRRQFFDQASTGAAALAGVAVAQRAVAARAEDAPATPAPAVHAGGSDELRVALIGCGGRGGGAAADALSVADAPLKLVALADVFQNRAEIVRRSLGEQFKERCDVPDDRIFTGFDAYKQAIDCLRPRAALRLCDRERRALLHGEADLPRRPEHPPDAGTGPQGRRQESQSGRGADVPPLRPPPGTF